LSKTERAEILVVEDDESISVLLKQVLELDDYRVAIVENGQKALEYLKDQTLPKIILSDLTMPVMDGVEFRRSQLKDPTLKTIPFLMMTADTQFSMEEIGLSAKNLLKKPLSIDDVLEKVRVALGTKLK
jgi:CheY-like chemotaxis protein